jgi:hypothetical protein
LVVRQEQTLLSPPAHTSRVPHERQLPESSTSLLATNHRGRGSPEVDCVEIGAAVCASVEVLERREIGDVVRKFVK